MTQKLHRFEFCVIHHSASSRDGTTLEDIRAWHKARGFREVGYHFVIEADGSVEVGRPLPEMGAHVRGRNRTSVGICAVGNNLDPQEAWSPVQIGSLLDLINALKFIWPGIQVVGHRDLAATECPGVDIEALA